MSPASVYPAVSQTGGPVPALPGPVGFVLGGGGGLGAVQVGMLKGLQAAGIWPDFIIGTSVGALNGAVLAAHPKDAAERLSALWHGIKREDVFGHLGSALWTLGRTHTHILKTDSLARMIRNAIEPSTFAELSLPLGVVAVNMATGQDQVIRDGPLVPALLASSAIPGLFPPVQMHDQPMVDGGLLANLPVSQAAAMAPAGTLVLLDCAVGVPNIPTDDLAEMITLATQLQFRDQLRAALPAVAQDAVVISLPPPAARHTSVFDFEQTAALINDSHAATADFLATLSAHHPGLAGDPFTRYTPGAAPK